MPTSWGFGNTDCARLRLREHLEEVRSEGPFDVPEYIAAAGAVLCRPCIGIDDHASCCPGEIKHVLTEAAVDNVRTGPAVKDVIAAAAQKGVVVLASEQCVAAAPAGQRVISGAAVDDVGPIVPLEPVVKL